MSAAERVLELVAPSGAEAEVTTRLTTQSLTRFANSFIHQNVSDTAETVRLRLHVDGRTAASSTSTTTPEGLAGLVERTLAAARLRPVDTGWAGLTPPTAPTGAGNHDRADVSPAERAAVVSAFVDAAGGLETAGYCFTAETGAAYANSTGHQLTGRHTYAAASGIARTGTSDGMARVASVRFGDLDGPALGALAASRARAGADPGDLQPGRYPVVLEPAAVGDMLMFLGMIGFNARAVAEGRSFVRLGEEQFDPAITLVDDPLGPAAPGEPFDAEGTPKRFLELVKAGVSSAIAHDRRTARQSGGASTGHAVPRGERYGAVPRHLALRPGAGEDLVARLDRGLLVTDFWYTRILDPRTQVVTGLTRNGVWLVEGGEIVRPVRNLRFTQSYLEALAPGNVLAVGAESAQLPDSQIDGTVIAPALHLASWNFTGGASG